MSGIVVLWQGMVCLTRKRARIHADSRLVGQLFFETKTVGSTASYLKLCEQGQPEGQSQSTKTSTSSFLASRVTSLLCTQAQTQALAPAETSLEDSKTGNFVLHFEADDGDSVADASAQQPEAQSSPLIPAMFALTEHLFVTIEANESEPKDIGKAQGVQQCTQYPQVDSSFNPLGGCAHELLCPQDGVFYSSQKFEKRMPLFAPTVARFRVLENSYPCKVTIHGSIGQYLWLQNTRAVVTGANADDCHFLVRYMPQTLGLSFSFASPEAIALNGWAIPAVPVRTYCELGVPIITSMLPSSSVSTTRQGVAVVALSDEKEEEEEETAEEAAAGILTALSASPQITTGDDSDFSPVAQSPVVSQAKPRLREPDKAVVRLRTLTDLDASPLNLRDPQESKHPLHRRLLWRYMRRWLNCRIGRAAADLWTDVDERKLYFAMQEYLTQRAFLLRGGVAELHNLCEKEAVLLFPSRMMVNRQRDQKVTRESHHIATTFRCKEGEEEQVDDFPIVKIPLVFCSESQSEAKRSNVTLKTDRKRKVASRASLRKDASQLEENTLVRIHRVRSGPTSKFTGQRARVVLSRNGYVKVELLDKRLPSDARIANFRRTELIPLRDEDEAAEDTVDYPVTSSSC